MRIAGITMTIEGADGERSPPNPFVTVSDAEGEALLALYGQSLDGRVRPGLARFSDDDEVVDDGEAERDAAEAEAERLASVETARLAAEQAEKDRAEAERLATEQAEAAEAERLAAEEAARIAAEKGGEGEGEDAPATDLADSFDLLEPDDFVKTGPRKGKPKADAVKNIIECDVTVEEIDAAWGARNAAE